MSDDLPERMHRAALLRNELAAKHAAPTPPRLPPSISPLRSPLEGEMNKLQRALEKPKPPAMKEFDIIEMTRNWEIGDAYRENKKQDAEQDAELDQAFNRLQFADAFGKPRQISVHELLGEREDVA